jgi:hypothetical protein
MLGHVEWKMQLLDSDCPRDTGSCVSAGPRVARVGSGSFFNYRLGIFWRGHLQGIGWEVKILDALFGYSQHIDEVLIRSG